MAGITNFRNGIRGRERKGTQKLNTRSAKVGRLVELMISIRRRLLAHLVSIVGLLFLIFNSDGYIAKELLSSLARPSACSSRVVKMYFGDFRLAGAYIELPDVEKFQSSFIKK